MVNSGVSSTEGRAIDPVCGMTVDPAKAKGSFVHDGMTYYFCSAGCREKFASDPAGWLARGPRGMRGMGTSTVQIVRGHAPAPGTPQSTTHRAPSTQHSTWTCPMHPEIVRDGPGACPICGMALEPRTMTKDEPENPELRDMTRRLWIAAALSAPLLVLAMSGMFGGLPWSMRDADARASLRSPRPSASGARGRSTSARSPRCGPAI